MHRRGKNTQRKNDGPAGKLMQKQSTAGECRRVREERHICEEGQGCCLWGLAVDGGDVFGWINGV